MFITMCCGDFGVQSWHTSCNISVGDLDMKLGPMDTIHIHPFPFTIKGISYGRVLHGELMLKMAKIKLTKNLQ